MCIRDSAGPVLYVPGQIPHIVALLLFQVDVYKRQAEEEAEQQCAGTGRRENRRGAGTAEAGAGCISRAAGVSDLQDQPDQFPDKGGRQDLNGADRKKGCADLEDRCI